MTGFRVHIITPRSRPQGAGLCELYDGILATKPFRRNARHMMDEDLRRLHRYWYGALDMLRRTGCVEWAISRRPEDLPETEKPA